MDSESVRYAVLGLSAASLDSLSSSQSAPGPESRDYICLSEAHQGRDSEMEILKGALSAILRRVCYFIFDIPKAWAQNPNPDYETKLVDALALQTVGTDPILSVCWLFLRIGEQVERSQIGWNFSGRSTLKYRWTKSVRRAEHRAFHRIICANSISNILQRIAATSLCSHVWKDVPTCPRPASSLR